MDPRSRSGPLIVIFLSVLLLVWLFAMNLLGVQKLIFGSSSKVLRSNIAITYTVLLILAMAIIPRRILSILGRALANDAEVIAGVSIFAMFCSLIVLVFGRKIFNTSTVFLGGVGSFLYLYVVFFGLASLTQRKQNIAIHPEEMFHISPQWERILSLLRHTVSILVLGVIVYGSLMLSYSVKRTTDPTTGLPILVALFPILVGTQSALLWEVLYLKSFLRKAS